MSGRTTRIVRNIGIALVVLVGCFLVTLAIPVPSWRTGQRPVPPLSFVPEGSVPPFPRRVWIDTDAACGQGRRTDPDDCFAILLLAQVPNIEIVGISTVFGNAPVDVTDSLTRELAVVLSADGQALPRVSRGSAGRLGQVGDARLGPAHRALQAALEAGPLTIIALGPLTNLAVALRERPDLQANVARLVVVMGRRLGHLFHPAEGAGRGILLGHGPIFRDFNVAMDTRAVAEVVSMDLATTFVPYEAAREIELTKADLDRLTALGGGPAWVAERARAWLGYWRDDVGRRGFYPFDLLAAAYFVAPDRFDCARTYAWVGEDPTLFIPFWRPTVLLVGQDRTRIEDAQVIGSALYCPGVQAGLGAQLRRWITPPAGPLHPRGVHPSRTSVPSMRGARPDSIYGLPHAGGCFSGRRSAGT